MRRQILTWLSNELEKAENCRARFVFGHFPIYLTDLHDADYQNSISEHEAREQIIKVLLDGRCDAYFCGHTHFGWENEIGLENRGHIRQIVAASLAYPALRKGWQQHELLSERRCLGWYLWKYYPDTGNLVKEFVEIDSRVPTVIFDN